MSLSTILEEVCPFVCYVVRCRRLRRRAEAVDILDNRGFAKYGRLSPEEIAERLGEEHTRARAMDEKTFKLTLSFSVGLTIVGLVTSSLIDSVSGVKSQVILASFFGLGTLFVLVAAFLALGALRTLPAYGYGTGFLLALQQTENRHKVLADALARQETMNTIRHLRNEAAYQTLRNGLVLVVCGLLLFLFTLVGKYIATEDSLSPVAYGQCCYHHVVSVAGYPRPGGPPGREVKRFACLGPRKVDRIDVACQSSDDPGSGERHRRFRSTDCATQVAWLPHRTPYTVFVYGRRGRRRHPAGGSPARGIDGSPR